MQAAGSEFPPTHWTLIAASTGPSRDAALTRLYEIYWPPLCAQARRLGVSPDDAEDVVQEFFVGLFASGSLQRADRDAGRFRSYLIGALKNHLGNRRAKLHAQKRGGGQVEFPLDAVDRATADDDREFDAEWARALIEEAMRRFTAENPGEPLCARAVSDENSGVSEAAAQLGITPAAVKSRVFRLRQRFRQIVREEVLRTVADPRDCDDELRHLCAVLDKVDGVKMPPP